MLSLTRFTLYLPFLFKFVFGNERANFLKSISQVHLPWIFLENSPAVRWACNVAGRQPCSSPYIFNTSGPIPRTIIARCSGPEASPSNVHISRFALSCGGDAHAPGKSTSAGFLLIWITRTRWAVLGKSLEQFIYLLTRVVKMRGDTQPISTGRGNDISSFQMRVKVH
jgi:hypothetical protein